MKPIRPSLLPTFLRSAARQFCSSLSTGRTAAPAALTALLAAAAWAQPAANWVIETAAGPGSYSGDGGPATAAWLRGPTGVAVDGDGNIYIVDRDNRRIRKVDADGVITTVAGIGECCYGGDGGPAIAARLWSPYDAVLDGAGNLYIADSSGHRIRKVDADGVITTAAGTGTAGFSGDGGPATAAQLRGPQGVAVDGAGNLYIADNNNHRVRKVDADGVITTVAGTGTSGFSGDNNQAIAAKLKNPRGVAVDGVGNLYIADTNNHRIRKVDAAGVIDTVAGTGTSGLGGDNGPATAAKLKNPQGVAVDGAGNLYIADNNNHRVRKVDADGVITTAAGRWAGFREVNNQKAAIQPVLNNPLDVAVDGAGNLYIADLWNHRIRKVDAAGIITTVAGTGDYADDGPAVEARLNLPENAVVDGAGNLYIADTNNHRIRKMDTAGNIATVAGTVDNGFRAADTAAVGARLSFPHSVALDGSGNFYIADRNNRRIRKVDAAGNITTVAGSGPTGFSGDGGPATSAKLNAPRGVALDGSGNLYIADTGNRRIRKVDAAGDIATVVGSGAQQGPIGDGGPALQARLNNPYSVAVDGSGNLYIADTDNHSIRKVDFTTDVITTVAGNGTSGFSGDGGPATAAQLKSPRGVALDGAGNLYIADTNNHCIRKVDAAGVITTLSRSGLFGGYGGDGGPLAEARLNAPSSVALDGSGNLYIVDRSNHRIRKVSPPPPPPAPRVVAPSPAVRSRTFTLSFVLPQDAAPAAQEVVLYAENGTANFRAQPSHGWIAASPARGNLAEDEETTVEVTVNPAGVRVGAHSGRLYIRSGGRITARVRVGLQVLPPEGPAVSERGVVNAAVMSALGNPGLFGPQLLPVAPGSLVAVRGENFTSGETVEAEGFPLPTSLGGVTVKFDGMAAPLSAVGPQRIEAQLPSALGMESSLEAGGIALATVVVETAETSSYPRRFFAAAYAPGVFTAAGEGTGQAMALFAETTTLAAPRGAGAESRPAQAGDMLEIYATGLGAVEPPIANGMNSCAPDGVCLEDLSNVVLRHTLERPRVSIGGVEIAAEGVLFSGLAPALAAVNVVVVEVPQGIEPSAAAEVVIAVGGRKSQSGVTIAVE